MLIADLYVQWERITIGLLMFMFFRNEEISAISPALKIVHALLKRPPSLKKPTKRNNEKKMNVYELNRRKERRMNSANGPKLPKSRK